MTDRATFDAYKAWAKQHLAGVEYSPTYVEISSTDQATIYFMALDGNGNWIRCSAKWGDTDVMWAAFPSTLPSGAQGPIAGAPPSPGALPAPGAFGILYLSVHYVQHYNIAPPKWPRPY